MNDDVDNDNLASVQAAVSRAHLRLMNDLRALRPPASHIDRPTQSHRLQVGVVLQLLPTDVCFQSIVTTKNYIKLTRDVRLDLNSMLKAPTCVQKSIQFIEALIVEQYL